MAYLSGVDVSYANGKASTSSLDFGIIKASEGLYKDPRFDLHWDNFRGAKIITGTYHFGRRGDGSLSYAAKQADTYLSIASHSDFFALDFERASDGTTITTSQGREFIKRVKANVAPRKVLLYSSRGTWPGDLGQDDNWVADYGGDPNRTTTSPRVPWKFWQYQGSPLDRNYFDGTMEDLRAWALLEEDTNVKFVSAVNVTSNNLLRVPAGTQLYYLDGSPAVKVPKIMDLQYIGLIDAHSGQYVVRYDYDSPLISDAVVRPALLMSKTGTIVSPSTPVPSDCTAAVASEKKRWTDWLATAPK